VTGRTVVSALMAISIPPLRLIEATFGAVKGARRDDEECGLGLGEPGRTERAGARADARKSTGSASFESQSKAAETRCHSSTRAKRMAARCVRVTDALRIHWWSKET